MALASDQQGELLRQVIMAKGGSQPIIDAANHFYRYHIPQLISSLQLVTMEGKIGTFSNPFLVRPTINDLKGSGKPRPLWPYEARRNGLSYMAQLFATFQLNERNEKGQLIPIPDQKIDEIYLGKIPAIIQSEVCHLYGLTPQERYAKGEGERDPGGYAIIKGMEKVLLNIENLRTGEAFLYDESGRYIVRYTSKILTDTTINIVLEDHDNIEMTFSKLGISNNSINIFYIFYVLGLTNNTIEKAFNIIDNFIIDDDLARQNKRRREMRYYLQTTANTFLAQTSGNQQQIYNILSGKIHDKNIANSQNRNNLIFEFIVREVFKNVPVIYRNDQELLAILATKIRMLAYMVAKYVEFKNGYRQVDDRDDWGNKILVTLGGHLAKKFGFIWKLMMTNIQAKVTSNRQITAAQIERSINKNQMAEQFINSFNKELWSTVKGQREVTIVDSLKRDNLIASITHIRRVSTPTNRRAKIREKRMIHNSQWGVVCPVMTSEGEACGLNKDSSVATYTSLERDDSIIKARLNGRQLIIGAKIINLSQGRILQFPGGEQIPVPQGIVTQTKDGVVVETEPAYVLTPVANKKYPLFLNGIHLGYCDSTLLREELIRLRRSQQLPFDTGIILNQYKELKIFTNEGRQCRPLMVVDPDTEELVIDKKHLRGSDMYTLMKEGAIEYVDVSEQVQTYILIAQSVNHLKIKRDEMLTTSARYRSLLEDQTIPPDQLKLDELKSTLIALQNLQKRMKYTHCEIDPTDMMGLSAISMPFAEFNPGPRDTYQAAMIRQALGANSTRMELRFDTTMKTILEPGVPSVSTDAHEWLGMDEYPGTRELVIAITVYGGGNQEDATIFNKDAIDLGLFKMLITHSYKTTICQSQKHVERIRIPDYPKSQADRYSKLDPETGIVRLGAEVKAGDCLVGKVITDNTTGQAKNDSLFVEINKQGIVDEVYITENAENCKLIRIRLREIRDLQQGDKLASRYSQKGTIGAILPGYQMPWIVSDNPHLNGVRPHIIFNPHGIPSRMTMGKLFEIIVGKTTAVTGERFNATAFRRFDINEYRNTLEQMGFSRSGKEKMMNGITGREMDVDIYVGTVAYQLLRHLVADKMQARSTGTIHYLTRQPTSGIRKEGGLRLGEMERDAFIEYGAGYLQQERLSISSDAHQSIVCTGCGMWATLNVERGDIRCRNCSIGEFRKVNIPYSFNLLTHYLNAVNIKVKLRTRDV